MATRVDVMDQLLGKMSSLLGDDWKQGWAPSEAVSALADAYATLADVEHSLAHHHDDDEG